VVPVNRRKAAIGITTIAMGENVGATAREVFKPAILLSAIGLVVAKNRLSGVIEPTPYEFQEVKEWREVGYLLGCTLMDYIIVGYEGRYFSFHEQGQLPRVPLAEHLFCK
jgi:DNA repair protein RadC